MRRGPGQASYSLPFSLCPSQATASLAAISHSHPPKNESRRFHSLRVACHVMSVIQSLSPLHPVRWQNQARETGKLHPLGAIRIEKSHCCTNIICQCLCQEKCGPYPEPLAMSAGEIAWPGDKKDLDCLTQGHVQLGGDREGQSELGGSRQTGADSSVCGLG